jgi:AraC-like DNA-binding protein
MLRLTDRSVTEICFALGLTSLGSFTSSFTRIYGRSPTAYRASFPPARAWAVIPMCVTKAYGRPSNTARLEKSG